MNGHIGIIIQPSPIDVGVSGILTRAQCELSQNTLMAVAGVHQQHCALVGNIVFNHGFTGELIAPLGGIAIGRHQLTGTRVNLLHMRQITHGGVAETTRRRLVRSVRLSHSHLSHRAITSTGTDGKPTMP